MSGAALAANKVRDASSVAPSSDSRPDDLNSSTLPPSPGFQRREPGAFRAVLPEIIGSRLDSKDRQVIREIMSDNPWTTQPTAAARQMNNYQRDRTLPDQPAMFTDRMKGQGIVEANQQLEKAFEEGRISTPFRAKVNAYGRLVIEAQPFETTDTQHAQHLSLRREFSELDSTVNAARYLSTRYSDSMPPLVQYQEFVKSRVDSLSENINGMSPRDRNTLVGQERQFDEWRKGDGLPIDPRFVTVLKTPSSIAETFELSKRFVAEEKTASESVIKDLRSLTLLTSNGAMHAEDAREIARSVHQRVLELPHSEQIKLSRAIQSDSALIDQSLAPDVIKFARNMEFGQKTFDRYEAILRDGRLNDAQRLGELEKLARAVRENAANLGDLATWTERAEPFASTTSRQLRLQRFNEFAAAATNAEPAHLPADTNKMARELFARFEVVRNLNPETQADAYQQSLARLNEMRDKMTDVERKAVSEIVDRDWSHFAGSNPVRLERQNSFRSFLESDDRSVKIPLSTSQVANSIQSLFAAGKQEALAERLAAVSSSPLQVEALQAEFGRRAASPEWSLHLDQKTLRFVGKNLKAGTDAKEYRTLLGGSQ